VTAYGQRERSRQWKPGWFPVFADGGGDFYAVVCGGAGVGRVIGFMGGEPEQEVEYASLGAMLATLAECFVRGAFHVKRGTFGIDNDKHRVIAKNHNPGLGERRPVGRPLDDGAREPLFHGRLPALHALRGADGRERPVPTDDDGTVRRRRSRRVCVGCDRGVRGGVCREAAGLTLSRGRRGRWIWREGCRC
jgi:hypothetical protein